MATYDGETLLDEEEEELLCLVLEQRRRNRRKHRICSLLHICRAHKPLGTSAVAVTVMHPINWSALHY
jgi:hypothetical protein